MTRWLRRHWGWCALALAALGWYGLVAGWFSGHVPAALVVIALVSPAACTCFSVSRCYLRVLGSVAPRKERQPAEEPGHEEVDEAKEHERRG